MKKKRMMWLVAGLTALSGLTACSKGIEKEYTMDIEGEAIVARLKEDESKTVTVVHCTRGMSLYNYYIKLPELEEDFVMPEHLVARKTEVKAKFIIINDKNKSEEVTDHGYAFIKWGEK